MIKNMRLVFKSLVFFFCIMTSCLNAKESFINEARDLFKADYIIWVDTIKKGRFEDTNQMFINPKKYFQ